MKLEHKTNQLKGRVDKLTHRLTTMENANDEGKKKKEKQILDEMIEGALDELEMRKAFKSSSLIDQRTLDRYALLLLIYIFA